MIPGAGDDKKKAFTLHEQGWYQDSFDLCTRLLAKEKDPSLEVLSATNLFFLKRYDDAETYFHDLIRKMPDSSYLHSYLAKVLAAKGDDAARGEYAAAVRLDPALASGVLVTTVTDCVGFGLFLYLATLALPMLR